MKGKKRVLSILVIIMIICTCFIFAGSPKKEGPVEIEFWVLNSRQPLTKGVIADFMAENPNIKINYVMNGGDEHKNSLKVAAASGSLPDVWFNWGGSLASYYVENGLTYDLSDYAKENEWNKKFDQAALDLATIDGQLAGYPIHLAILGMFYRKDIFEKCGVSAPKNLDELESVMSTLKSKGYIPIAACRTSHVMRFVEALLEEYAGPQLHDDLKSLKVSWDNPAVVETFTKYKEYADLGYFPEGFITLDGREARALLYAEKAVMDPEGPWMENNIFNDQQDHSLFGYFKIPAGKRMSGFVEMFQINKNVSKEKLDAIIKFADFFFSLRTVNHPDYGNLLKHPIPNKEISAPARLTMTNQMIEDMAKSGSFLISDQGLPQEVIHKWYEVQEAIVNGDMTPKQAAEYMQKSIEEYKANL